MPATNTFHLAIDLTRCRCPADKDKPDVSALSCELINRMSRGELIQIARESGALSLRPATERRLSVLDRSTLLRLVYMIRGTALRHGQTGRGGHVAVRSDSGLTDRRTFRHKPR